MIAPTLVRTGVRGGRPAMTWRSWVLVPPDSSITVTTRPWSVSAFPVSSSSG
jgi:hypothetical protein